MDKKILRELAAKHPKDLMPPFDTIVGLDNGFDAVCSFVEYFGGLTVYIPQEKSVFMRCLERAAAEEFDGNNFNNLSRKYGLSQRHLYRLFRGV